MTTGYGTFCPVAKAAEAFANRWTPLILAEMMKGSDRFSDIQNGVPMMPRSLLARRLKEMEQAGLILRVPHPQGRGHLYHLTEAGNDLRMVVNQLAAWGSTWRLPYLDAQDRNVSFLMWFLRQVLLPRQELPARYVIQFDFRNVPRRDHKLRQWWLVKRDGDIELCYTDMGFESDLVIDADLNVLTRVIVGVSSLRQARASGDVVFSENALSAKLVQALELKEPPQMRLMRVPSSAELAALTSRGPVETVEPDVRTKSRAA